MRIEMRCISWLLRYATSGDYHVRVAPLRWTFDFVHGNVVAYGCCLCTSGAWSMRTTL
ncbi:uncharacterized protein BDW47DRAFT_97394 [Aspergillus candidus]|uniref:Uncharacterized protein n=1 Tax=Aspergillus candidus TaxID=41067 RepID=A0A2I2FPJ3_ASPCN|nr:hypothetical protein BDW47DRAFT_97394 [Aspergillus candidus]PLB42557.1 hypothetical protein BDW47DRAFT_97394 [Aspergillus candidus]